MMQACSDIQRLMRKIDVDAFRKVAALKRSYILVRKPNPAARKYIGQPGFYPKSLECKFKAAEQDFYHVQLGKWLTVGGLVVNPSLKGFEKAFNSKKSFAAAMNIWNQYRETVLDTTLLNTNDEQAPHMLPRGKLFGVNIDRTSPYYGCITMNRLSQTIHPTYLHSDYNLYAIIPTSHHKSLKSFLGELKDKPHYQEVNFFEYQHHLNRLMGVPMIQQAPQELSGQHIDDQVIVFMPDLSNIYLLPNQLEIRDFYQTILGGRQLVSH